MTTNEMKEHIKMIMLSDFPFGLTIYACLKKGEDISVKRIKTNDELRDCVKEIVLAQIKSKYVDDEVMLDSSDNISDNNKSLYEIVQKADYAPFNFICEYENSEEIYTDQDQDSLMGLLFKVSYEDNFFWAYQHIYHVRMIKRSKSLYAIFTKGDTYVPLDKDIMKIDSRIDLIIIDNSIITSNISLIQSSFGFDKYIRKEAVKTIEIIGSLGIISDMTKIFAYEEQPKLTNAKKLLKVKNSPVLKMNGATLITELKRHRRYSAIFKFDDNNTIIISSQKDVAELVKMFNDDIVISELTHHEYDSSSKHILEPINENG